MIRSVKHNFEVELLALIEEAEAISHKIEAYKITIDALNEKILATGEACVYCKHFKDDMCTLIETQVSSTGICDNFIKDEDENEATGEEIHKE